MSQPYDVPGATPHDPADWEWVDLGANGGYWVRKGTNDKSYNCTEYAMAKLFGDPAEWGAAADTTDTDEIEKALRDRGFTEVPADRCGCDPELLKECAVLYFAIVDGRRGAEPFHVEVFDREHCDWAGKGGPGHPIRHRRSPTDYPSTPEERAKTEVVILCREGTPGPYVSDKALHDQARRVDPPPPPPPPAPSPPPYTPGPLLRLWNFFYWLVGVLVGWMLHALLVP